MGSFQQWFIGRSGHRPPILPPPYSVVPIIARAGPHGISRRELGDVIDLDGRLLDELLAALVSLGQVTAAREGDHTVYRATWGTV
jgi:hypothetical protein